MVYNEWGELVDPEDLKKDPKSKKMDIKSVFRLLNLNWHYRVSSHTFFVILPFRELVVLVHVQYTYI